MHELIQSLVSDNLDDDGHQHQHQHQTSRIPRMSLLPVHRTASSCSLQRLLISGCDVQVKNTFIDIPHENQFGIGIEDGTGDDEDEVPS
jgi:hypothetical protein